MVGSNNMRAGSRSGKRPVCVQRVRPAFSLFEVLVSLAILVGGVLAASRLIDIGLEEADLSRAQNLAVLLAESKLAEIEAGLEGAGSVSGSGDYEEHPGFKYEVETESTDVSGVTGVKVKIVFASRGGEFHYTVSRWLRQPSEGGGFMR